MHHFSSLPPRRKFVFFFYSVFTALLLVVGTYSIGLSGVKSELGALVLLGLFLLGLLQFINALYNSLQGSRVQLIYFIACVVFLVIYVALLTTWLPRMGGLTGSSEYLFLLSPLLMATAYCLILYLDHPDQYQRSKTAKDNTLDGGIHWEEYN